MSASNVFHPVDDMTPRARLYLSVAALRHILIGLACLCMPDAFVSHSFDQIVAVLPMEGWGIVFLGAGATCTAAALTRSETLARVGLILSAASTAVWAGGFVAAYLAGTAAAPTGPIIYWAVTFKDLVVCRQPLRSPFEPLIRALIDERRRPQRG